MEDKKLNEQESLALIASMINNTRERLARNSGRPFLIWGYTVIAVSLFEYMAINLGWSAYYGLIWCLIPIIGHPLTWLACRGQKHEPKTYIDRCIDTVWTVMGVTCMVAVLSEIIYGTYTTLFFSVVMLIGCGVAITGLIIKDFTTSLVGTLAIGGSLVFPIMRQFQPTVEEVGAQSLVAYISADILIFAAIFFVMLVIPGHILNYKTRRKKVCSEH